MGHHAARRVGITIAFFRQSWVVRRRRDGDFDLVIDPRLAATVRDLLGQLTDLLDTAPDDPSLRRLHPPAYLEDAERDAAYQLLAGDELRQKRREAVAGVLASLDRERLTEGDLWQWLQALNGLRLVVGTRLDISEDDDRPDELDPTDPATALWAVYDLTTALQYELVRALGG